MSDNENTIKYKKTNQRQTNIELCRLISIILIIFLHSTTQSLGDNVNLGVRLLKGFSIIGVNVFILITGYFSATPKKTSLINLAFICLFWQIIKIVCRIEFGEVITYKHLFFITSSNWFIVSYIGLLFFSPILNCFCQSVSKKVLLGGVFYLLLIEIWFDWLPPYPDAKIGANNGYSILSFTIIYLLGRAIKLYGMPYYITKYRYLLYICCSLLIGTIAHISAVLVHDTSGLYYSYLNPIVILSSVAFLTIFEQMKIQSAFINHIAKSTIACLFGHVAIMFLFRKQFQYIYDNYSSIKLVFYWVLAVVIVFIASIAIDQIRLLLYKPIEKILKDKINNNYIFEDKQIIK